MGFFESLGASYRAWQEKRRDKKEGKKRAASVVSPPQQQAQAAAAVPAPQAGAPRTPVSHQRQQQQVLPAAESEAFDFASNGGAYAGDEFDDIDQLDQHDLHMHASALRAQGLHARGGSQDGIPRRMSLGQMALKNVSPMSSAMAAGLAPAPHAGHTRGPSSSSASSAGPAHGGIPLAPASYRSASPTVSSHSLHAHGAFQLPAHRAGGIGASGLMGTSPSSSEHSNRALSFPVTPNRGHGSAAESKEEHDRDADLFALEMEAQHLAMGRQIYRAPAHWSDAQQQHQSLPAPLPSYPHSAHALTDDEKLAERLQQEEYLEFMQESGQLSVEDAEALARASQERRDKEARRAARRAAKDAERAARHSAAAAAAAAAAGSSSSSSSVASGSPAAGSLSQAPPSLQLPQSLPSSPLHVDSASSPVSSGTPSPNPEEGGGASAAAVAAFAQFRARAHAAQIEAAAATAASAGRPHALSASSSLSNLHQPSLAHAHSQPHSHHHSPFSHRLPSPFSASSASPHSHHHHHHHMPPLQVHSSQAHPRAQSNADERGAPPGLRGLFAQAAQHSASASPSRSLSYSHSASAHALHTPPSAAPSSSQYHYSGSSFASPATTTTSSHNHSTPPLARASSLSRAELNSLTSTFLYVPSPSSVQAKREAAAKQAALAAVAAAVAAETAAATPVAPALTETLVLASAGVVSADGSSAATVTSVSATVPPSTSLPAAPLVAVVSSTAAVVEIDEETSSLDSCSICLDDYTTTDQLRILPCLHRFHAACVDDWLGRSSVCPNCNTDVREAM